MLPISGQSDLGKRKLDKKSGGRKVHGEAFFGVKNDLISAENGYFGKVILDILE